MRRGSTSGIAAESTSCLRPIVVTQAAGASAPHGQGDMIELPRQEPCEICETLAGRTNVPVVGESEFTITVVLPMQFEVGQCCVVTRRHAGTLLI